MVLPTLTNEIICLYVFKNCIRELRRDQSFKITKADKLNTIVGMDKSEYIEKKNGLLSDQQTYSKLRTNPQDDTIKDFNKAVKKALRNRKDLIKQFICEAPPHPYMYGLVKTHKPGNPMRPIISSVGSAAYKFSKWLVRVLSPLLGSIFKSHTVHSNDLMEKLNTS